MKIRPLRDRVLVKRVTEEKTKGGIIIPDSADKPMTQGEVVAVGDGRILDNGEKVPLAVKVGDKVLFGKYAGTEVKVEGEDYLVMREDDILGIIEQ